MTALGYTAGVRGLAIVIVLGWTAVAHARPATLVALAPARDARRAVAIGPAGEVYEPDGSGAWVRTRAGGTAVELVDANVSAGIVIAGAKRAPPFKLKNGVWSAIHLAPRAKALIGRGSRALAAVGKTVFALDKRQPRKLADAPAAVVGLAAGPGGAVIATAKGLHRQQGAAWKPIKKAPRRVRELVSERWALVDKGALDLETLKIVPWPRGFSVVHATTIGNRLVGVARHGKQLELVTVTAGKRKLTREPIPVALRSPVVGVVVDSADRAVVATRDGTLALRVGGTWTTTQVRVEIAPPRPGPAPAASQ